MFSIIIPTYGIKGISMTDRLLDSISKFDNPNLYEFIISDDESSIDTISRLISLRDKYENIFKIIPLFNPRYHSFAKTVNRGIEISNNNNDILLLNNDMLTLTSFEPFIDFIKENKNMGNKKIGIIGAKLLYPDLRIQHAGIIRIPFLHYFMHRFKYRYYNYEATNFPTKYIAVTGACQYISRDLINSIGYYDEGYILSYEDIDYCINAQTNGYDVWYIPDVIMIHYESITRHKSRYNHQNFMRLWDKWSKSYESLDPNIKSEEMVTTGAMWLGALHLITK